MGSAARTRPPGRAVPLAPARRWLAPAGYGRLMTSPPPSRLWAVYDVAADGSCEPVTDFLNPDRCGDAERRDAGEQVAGAIASCRGRRDDQHDASQPRQ